MKKILLYMSKRLKKIHIEHLTKWLMKLLTILHPDFRHLSMILFYKPYGSVDKFFLLISCLVAVANLFMNNSFRDTSCSETFLDFIS